jgi:hypothetical protein
VCGHAVRLRNLGATAGACIARVSRLIKTFISNGFVSAARKRFRTVAWEGSKNTAGFVIPLSGSSAFADPFIGVEQAGIVRRSA